MFCIAVHLMIHRDTLKRWAIFYASIMIIMCVMVGVGVIIVRPMYTSKVTINLRIMTCFFICYWINWRHISCDIPIEKLDYKVVVNIFAAKSVINNIYMCTNIFLTPFSDSFFTSFTTFSLCFSVEFSMINLQINNKGIIGRTIISIMLQWTWNFLQAYFIRRVLTQFFMMQVEAEKNQEALT